MHEATPASVAFRSFVGGGGRGLVDEHDPTKELFEHKGTGMKNEAWAAREAPMPYGLRSVVAKATKGADGQITESAEAFMSFLGGNRSLSVAGVIDDRRHGMHHMAEGDVALFRLASDLLQLHLTSSGGFWSTLEKSTLRLQLVQQSQQRQGASSSAPAGSSAGRDWIMAGTLDASSGGDGSSG